MKKLLDQIQHLIETEGDFTFSRSSGPGGQNVNKLNTKAHLFWNIHESSLDEKTKERLINKLGVRIQTYSEESRSQDRNKKNAIEKMISIIKNALKENKIRRKTHLPKKQKEKRLKEKHQRTKSIKRRHIDLEEIN